MGWEKFCGYYRGCVFQTPCYITSRNILLVVDWDFTVALKERLALVEGLPKSKLEEVFICNRIYNENNFLTVNFPGIFSAVTQAGGGHIN